MTDRILSDAADCFAPFPVNKVNVTTGTVYLCHAVKKKKIHAAAKATFLCCVFYKSELQTSWSSTWDCCLDTGRSFEVVEVFYVRH